MSNAPWNPVPGWDVPRSYYAPDEPNANEDSFWEMVEERFDIIDCCVVTLPPQQRSDATC